jgi:transcriptional regulator with XRE-family HTH domain
MGAMPSVTARVAARVRALRARRGVSQDALAEKTGLNRLTITRLEAAAHPPNVETLEKIARALHVTVAELVR